MILALLFAFTPHTPAAAQSCAAPTSGLIHWWKLDDGTGVSTTADSAGSNSGTLASMDPATDWVAGQLGDALTFDGNSDHVNIDTPIDITGTKTVSLWLNLASLSGDKVAFYASDGSNNDYLVIEIWNNRIYATQDNVYGIKNKRSSITLSTGTWYNVVVVKTSAGIQNIYINGADVTEDNGDYWGDGNNATNLGAAADTPSSTMNGMLDDVRVYNRALSATEAQDIYNDGTGACTPATVATCSIPTGNLIGYWKLDDGSGTSAADSSGSGNTGTLNGAPTWTTGHLNGALNFANGDYVTVGNIAAMNGITNLTLSAWMKRNGTNNQVLLGKQTDSSSEGTGMEFWGGNVNFYVGNGSYTDGHVALNDTAWHHLVLVYDGTQTGNANRLKGYVDGVPQTLTYNGTIPATTTTDPTPFSLGRSSTISYSEGQIDDVRLYTRSLSDAEVLNLYDSSNGACPTSSCSGPEKLEGTIIFNTDMRVLQYCDGTQWKALHGNSCGAVASCTGPARGEGTLAYNTNYNVPQICIGGQWVGLGIANAGAGTGGCTAPSRPEGAVIYNAGTHAPQYCDGSQWVSFGGGGGGESGAPGCSGSGGCGPTSGLVSLWDMEDGSGTTAADGIGSNDGALTNGPVWDATGGLNGTGAVHFDGNNDYIEAPYQMPGGQSVTISYWMKEDILDDYRPVTSNTDGGNKLWGSMVWQAGYLGMIYVDSGGTYYTVDSTTTPIASANTWYHIVTVMDVTDTMNGDGTFHIYVNGVEAPFASNTFSDWFGQGSPSLWIGQDRNGYNFDGVIDAVRIYNRALTATEVQDLYDAENAGCTVSGGSGCGPTSGLLSTWLMDDASGTTAADSTGSNDGTLTNGPTWGTGKIDGAANFDGTDDYINVGTHATLDNLSAMTVAAWIYPNNADAAFRIVTKSTECCLSQGTNGWRFIMSDNGSALDKGLDFHVDYSGTNLDREANNVITANTWQHVVVTWDGSTSASNVHMYINGVEPGYFSSTNATGSRVDDSTTPIAIGGKNGLNPGDYFDGLIDSVHIYNRVLSATEVQDLYDAENAGCSGGGSGPCPEPTANLVGRWKLDENSGTTATDETGGASGTLANGPVWQAISGKIGGALEFDGGNDVITLPAGYAANNTQMTVTAWIKSHTAVTTDRQIIYDESSTGNCGTPIFDLNIWDGNTGNPGTEIRLDVDNTTVASSGEVGLADDTWYFVAAVFDSVSDTHTIYINNTAYPTSTAASAISNTAVNARIGNGAGTCTANAFNGLIDDLHLYNTALNATQITELYNAGSPGCTGSGGGSGGGGASCGATSGLVGRWAMDQVDSAAAWQPSGGHTGGALEFDGTNDFVDVPGTDFDITGNEVTVAAWINADVTTGIRRIVSIPANETAGSEKYALLVNGGNLEFWLSTGSDSSVSASYAYAGSWHHVAGVYNGSTIKVYRDGVEQNSASKTGTIAANTNGNFQIGRYGPTYGQYFDGKIDDVRVFNRALSGTEIADIYGCNCPAAPTTNLAAHWALNEASGSSSAADSVNGNTGTLTNMTPASDWVTGQIAGALDFDGTNDQVVVNNSASLVLASSYSLSIWFKTNTVSGGYRTMLAKLTSPGNNYYIQLNNDELNAGFYDSAWHEHETTTLNLSTGVWYHAVAVFSDSDNTFKLYVNGTEVLSEAETGTPVTSSSGPLYIGSNAVNDEFFNGQIDDIRIYSTALTATQVHNLYVNGNCQ